MTRVLVTGGAGFIGSNLVEALLARGDDVRVLDNFSTGSRANLAALGRDVEVVEGDLRSYERVHTAVRGVEVVFHQGATDYVMTDEVYKARHEGEGNPNAAMIQALKKAGVDFRLCGQAALARKIDRKDMMPEVQLDLWALTTIIALQQQGYVLIAP